MLRCALHFVTFFFAGSCWVFAGGRGGRGCLGSGVDENLK